MDQQIAWTSRERRDAVESVSGWAFAVGDDTRQSADPVGPEVRPRDSILFTYFVNHGTLRILRNRGKRLDNFLLNEFLSRR